MGWRPPKTERCPTQNDGLAGYLMSWKSPKAERCPTRNDGLACYLMSRRFPENRTLTHLESTESFRVHHVAEFFFLVAARDPLHIDRINRVLKTRTIPENGTLTISEWRLGLLPHEWSFHKNGTLPHPE